MPSPRELRRQARQKLEQAVMARRQAPCLSLKMQREMFIADADRLQAEAEALEAEAAELERQTEAGRPTSR
jgi:hypothetical protein